MYKMNKLKYYLYSENLDAVYCYIPKNACSTFKYFMIENSSFSNLLPEVGEVINTLCSHALAKHIQIKDLQLLNDTKTFKYIVLRNPYLRLFSGFANKLVQNKVSAPFVMQLLSAINKVNNEEKTVAELTFYDFIQYLARTDNAELNDHWLPQDYFILDNIKFDLHVQFEKLSEGVDCLVNQTGGKFDHLRSKSIVGNKINYSTESSIVDYSKVSISDLRCLPALPKASSFYTKELLDLVSKRYEKDIKMYDSTFSVSSVEAVAT
jgi:hypothetical protein